MALRVRALIGCYRSYPRPYWFLLAGMATSGIGTFVLPFETLYLMTERHLPLTQASAIFASYGAGSLVAALIGGLLADRIGRRPTMIGAMLFLAATTFGLAFAHTFFPLAILTFGIGWWISKVR